MPAIFFCYGHKLKLTNKAEQVQESRDGASGVLASMEASVKPMPQGHDKQLLSNKNSGYTSTLSPATDRGVMCENLSTYLMEE